MLASGLNLEDALTAAEAFEAEVPELLPTLTARQARNQRYYHNKRLKASDSKTDKTVQDVSDAIKTASDAAAQAASRTRVVTPSLPSLRSEELGVGGGVTPERVPPTDDWPAGKADHHAKLLVETVASPWLDPQKSPDLVTTRGRVAAWKRDGASWDHDVLPVVTGLSANRRSRISSWKFFDAAISRSIAENRAALEIPEATRSARGQGPPNITDRISAEHAEARRRALES